MKTFLLKSLLGNHFSVEISTGSSNSNSNSNNNNNNNLTIGSGGERLHQSGPLLFDWHSGGLEGKKFKGKQMICLSTAQQKQTLRTYLRQRQQEFVACSGSENALCLQMCSSHE